MKTKIENLKKHIEGIKIDEDSLDFGEEEVTEIRINYLKLVKYYLRMFDEFKKHFSNYDSEEIKELIKIHNEHYRQLLSWKNQPSSSNYSNHLYENKIITYIDQNYEEAREFFDLCIEVFDLGE
jgi:hypothetical protein